MRAALATVIFLASVMLARSAWPTVDADALTWATNVTAAGGGLTRNSVRAVNDLSVNTKIFGIWSKTVQASPLAGNSITSALVNLKWANSISMTDTGFNPSAYSETNGITGDGTNCLISGSVTIGTATNASMWIYKRTTNGAGNEYYMGCNQLGDRSSHLQWNSGEKGILGGGLIGANITGSATRLTGLLGINAFAATNNTYYQNGVALATGGSPSDGVGVEIYILAANNTSGVDLPSVGTFGPCFVCTGLSPSEAFYFNAIVQQSERLLGR